MTATRIAAMLGDDGTVWKTQDGRTLEDLVEDYGGVTTQHPDRPYLTRFLFDDGSAIVASEAGWDIEGSKPWSWAGEEDPRLLSDEDRIRLGHLSTAMRRDGISLRCTIPAGSTAWRRRDDSCGLYGVTLCVLAGHRILGSMHPELLDRADVLRIPGLVPVRSPGISTSPDGYAGRRIARWL